MAAIFGRRRRIRAAYEALFAAWAAADGASGAAAERVRRRHLAALVELWLREAGVQVALNTGFDREITDLLLDALRWRSGVVDAVVCAVASVMCALAPTLGLMVLWRLLQGA